MEENKALVGLAQEMEAPQQTYCSFDFKDMEPAQRAVYFNAVSNTQNRLTECVNKKLHIVDVYAEEITIVDQKTGEADNAIRIVLIDDKGEGYGCVSKGVFNAMKKVIAVNGPAPWNPPLTLIPKSITTGTNKTTTLEMG